MKSLERNFQRLFSLESKVKQPVDTFSEDMNFNKALLRNYTVTGESFWTGRVDDPEDRDSYRIHQVVRLLNLRDIKSGELDCTKLNICLLCFWAVTME